jgi:hypothetical protein
MKCAHHQTEAVAVCAHCGRAMCGACLVATPSGRLTCSEKCSQSLTHREDDFASLTRRHTQSARINAVFYLLCGLLSVAGAIGARFYLPSPFLIWFCAGCGFIFIASGAWQWLVSRKPNR